MVLPADYRPASVYPQPDVQVTMGPPLSPPVSAVRQAAYAQAAAAYTKASGRLSPPPPPPVLQVEVPRPPGPLRPGLCAPPVPPSAQYVAPTPAPVAAPSLLSPAVVRVISPVSNFVGRSVYCGGLPEPELPQSPPRPTPIPLSVHRPDVSPVPTHPILQHPIQHPIQQHPLSPRTSSPPPAASLPPAEKNPYGRRQGSVTTSDGTLPRPRRPPSSPDRGLRTLHPVSPRDAGFAISAERKAREILARRPLTPSPPRRHQASSSEHGSDAYRAGPRPRNAAPAPSALPPPRTPPPAPCPPVSPAGKLDTAARQRVLRRQRERALRDAARRDLARQRREEEEQKRQAAAEAARRRANPHQRSKYLQRSPRAGQQVASVDCPAGMNMGVLQDTVGSLNGGRATASFVQSLRDGGQRKDVHRSPPPTSPPPRSSRSEKELPEPAAVRATSCSSMDSPSAVAPSPSSAASPRLQQLFAASPHRAIRLQLACRTLSPPASPRTLQPTPSVRTLAAASPIPDSADAPPLVARLPVPAAHVDVQPRSLSPRRTPVRPTASRKPGSSPRRPGSAQQQQLQLPRWDPSPARTPPRRPSFGRRREESPTAELARSGPCTLSVSDDGVGAAADTESAAGDPVMGRWLQRLGLGAYAGLFAAHHVDWEALLLLREQDLSDMGLPIGPRRKIAVAAASLRQRQR